MTQPGLASDSTVRTLVEATSRALLGRDCSDLTSPSRWTAPWRWVTRHRSAQYDPIGPGSPSCAAVAEFLVRQYDGSQPSVVILGSPHGSAVHLAVALRAAWLPTEFDIQIAADGPLATTHADATIAARIVANNPGVTVRRVFDSRAPGADLRLNVQWHALPAAYQRFLEAVPSASPAVLILQAALDAELVRQLERWANQTGARLAATAYGTPSALSAVVADLHRATLRRAGKTGNRLVIECGRLLDPYHVRRAGLVPYWCENASRDALNAAEWWLAGSPPFTSIDVIPGYINGDRCEIGDLRQWRAMADFGTRQRYVDRRAVRAYLTRPLPPRAATAVLRRHPYDLPPPEALDLSEAVDALQTLLAPR